MVSCPNCGFDLNSEGVCSVCGFGSPQGKGHDPVESHSQKAEVTEGSLAGTDGLVDVDTRVAPSSTGTLNGNRSVAHPVTATKRRPSVTAVLVGIVALMLIAGVGAIVLRQQAASSVGVSSARLASRSGGSGSSRSVGSLNDAVASVANKPGKTTNAEGSADGAALVSTQSTETGGSHGTSSPSVKVSRVGYSAPVGASPESIRATHPVDLYNPPKEPMYNIIQRVDFPPLTSENSYVKWMLAHTHQQEKYLRERWVRASIAVAHHLIIHRSVLRAFLLTPREWFVRSYNLPKTYENSALPIGYGQTISGPDLVAHMTDALGPRSNQKILEIGTGSGYQSALLSQLSNYVYTIEIVRPLAEQTNKIYLRHTKQMPEYANIHRRLADGYYGWPEFAPFDRIIVTTGIDHIPPDLLKELKPGGIMVIPIGPPSGQTILKITKTVDKNGRVHLNREDIYHGIKDIFVPFTASSGGTHDTGRVVRR